MRALAVVFAFALALASVAAADAQASQEPRRAAPRTPRPPRTPAPAFSYRSPLSAPQSAAERLVARHGPARPPTPAPTPRPRTVPERLAAAWPGDDREALAVVRCETGGTFDPAIYNRQGSGASGLFQFLDSTYRSVGGTPPAATDSVEEQTRRAWRLYQQSGWRPWVCQP